MLISQYPMYCLEKVLLGSKLPRHGIWDLAFSQSSQTYKMLDEWLFIVLSEFIKYFREPGEPRSILRLFACIKSSFMISRECKRIALFHGN